MNPSHGWFLGWAIGCSTFKQNRIVCVRVLFFPATKPIQWQLLFALVWKGNCCTFGLSWLEKSESFYYCQACSWRHKHSWLFGWKNHVGLEFWSPLTLPFDMGECLNPYKFYWSHIICGVPWRGLPQNWWFVGESPTKIWITLGYPNFRKPSYS